MSIYRFAARVLPAFLLLAGTISPLPSVAGPKFVPGYEAHSKASKLTSEIHWYQSLDQAEAEAKRDGKLVFWMHMLGNLSGTT